MQPFSFGDIIIQHDPYRYQRVYFLTDGLPMKSKHPTESCLRQCGNYERLVEKLSLVTTFACMHLAWEKEPGSANLTELKTLFKLSVIAVIVNRS